MLFLMLGVSYYSTSIGGTLNVTGNLQKKTTTQSTQLGITVTDCEGNVLRSIPDTVITTTKYTPYVYGTQQVRFVVIRKEPTPQTIVTIDTTIRNINYDTTNGGSFSLNITRNAITPSRYNYIVKAYMPEDNYTAVVSEREYTLSSSGGAFPIGSVIAYMGNANTVANLEESGWFKCDGTDINDLGPTGSGKLTADEVTALVNTIGTHLPNLRGQFLRGVDEGRNWDDDVTTRTGGETINIGGINYPAGVRSEQAESMRKHTHSGTTSTNGLHNHGGETGSGGYERSSDSGGTSGTAAENEGSHKHSISADGNHNHTFTTGDPGNAVSGQTSLAGNENRPDNVAVYWLIRGR